MKKIFSWLLIAVITFTLLEFALSIYVRVTDLQVDVPSYSLSNVRRYWIDNNQFFGAIHQANISYGHTRNCYDVTYRTNNLGFREKNSQLSDTIIEKEIKYYSQKNNSV